jgi:predicted permease
VVLQTAMTLVLLVGSGLLARSFSEMLATDLGIRADRVLTFRLTAPESSYRDPASIAAFEERLLGRLAEVPGVEAVGATSHLPIAVAAPGTAFVVDGRPVEPGQLPPLIHYSLVKPGYFAAMGMPVQRGRDFDRRDLEPALREVIVNTVVVDRFWPGQDPIGKRFRPSGGDANQWFTVAGVVAPVLQNGVRQPPPALIYFPKNAGGFDGSRTMTYVLRGRSAVPDAAAVRAAVWAVDPNLPLAVVQAMSEVVDRSYVQFTFTLLTLGIAALTGLVLGAVGLYGVLSYIVTLRVREIGVRLALGAPPSQVMRSIVLQGLVVAAIGLAVGVGGAIALTRLLGNLLFNTAPLDVATFAAMSGVLFLVALLASYLPARRAAAVSPLESLRGE